MPTLRVTDVPDHIVTALKNRAHQNQRTLEGELRHILESVALGRPTSALTTSPIKLHQVDVGPEAATWSRSELYGDDGR